MLTRWLVEFREISVIQIYFGGGGVWAPERHLVLNHLEIFVVSIGIFWSGIDGNVDIYVVEIFMVIYGVSHILLDWLTLLADENERKCSAVLKKL